LGEERLGREAGKRDLRGLKRDLKAEG